MLRTLLHILVATIATVLIYITYLVWFGAQDVVQILDTIPSKRLFITGTVINSILLLVTVLLHFIVPSNRRILYGAFTSLFGLFTVSIFSQSTGFFTRPFFFEYLGVKLFSTAASSADASVAIVVIATLLVLCWRELKRTPEKGSQ